MYTNARDAVRDCQKLWKWLAETGSPYKFEWPDPKAHELVSSCPLCEWVKNERDRLSDSSLTCGDKCPITLSLGVTCLETVYGQWEEESGDEKASTDRLKLLAGQFLDLINHIAKDFELPPVTVGQEGGNTQ